MQMNMYAVTMYYKTLTFDSQTTFEVNAYSESEAEDKALEQFTALGFDHIGKLIYQTEII